MGQHLEIRLGLAVDDVSGGLEKQDALYIAHSISLGDPSLASSQPFLWEDAHQRAINARTHTKRDSDRLDYAKGEDDALTVLKIVTSQSSGLVHLLLWAAMI